MSDDHNSSWCADISTRYLNSNGNSNNNTSSINNSNSSSNNQGSSSSNNPASSSSNNGGGELQASVVCLAPLIYCRFNRCHFRQSAETARSVTRPSSCRVPQPNQSLTTLLQRHRLNLRNRRKRKSRKRKCRLYLSLPSPPPCLPRPSSYRSSLKTRHQTRLDRDTHSRRMRDLHLVRSD